MGRTGCDWSQPAMSLPTEVQRPAPDLTSVATFTITGARYAVDSYNTVSRVSVKAPVRLINLFPAEPSYAMRTRFRPGLRV